MAQDNSGAEHLPAPGLHEDVFFSASDGLRLHAADYGRHDLATRDRLPVVCLPGLTRNSSDFDALARMLTPGDFVIRVKQLTQIRPLLEAVLAPVGQPTADGSAQGESAVTLSV